MKIYPGRDLCQEVEDCGRTSRVNFDLLSNGALRSCNDEIGRGDDLDLFLHGRYHGDKGYLIEKKYGQMLENIGI